MGITEEQQQQRCTAPIVLVPNQEKIGTVQHFCKKLAKVLYCLFSFGKRA